MAVALAYPAFARASGLSGAAATSATADTPAPPWSPGSVDDEALAKLVPRRMLERASALKAQGYIAQVRRGAFAGEDVPAVMLATCTVRFLVPRDLAFARCDCSAGTGCEHVLLAVWAFRVADEKEAHAREVAVEVAATRATEGEGGPALDAACTLP